MSLLLPIITLAVSIKMPLFPIITIITYYYVFEMGQLADEIGLCVCVMLYTYSIVHISQ